MQALSYVLGAAAGAIEMWWQALRQRCAGLQGQYNGDSTGFGYQYALARALDVAIGSLLASVLSFIAPW